ncbi:serine/threonine-protein kinase [Nocardia sp. NPDC006630]|uniref:serine/threonine-protein kinase n=1 Tax=Nocardia sp. NPDC006630 TaxID=3157181 RepID=UPI0033AE3A25
MSIGPGSIVGGYRIERVLGTGGMGTVYLAKHPELPRWDALKVLSPQFSTNDEYRARFEREANLASALDHPNIVSIYNRGEDHGQLWIAMQYVNGIDAADAAAQKSTSMTPWRALHITTEVGRGLDHAHRRGLLHRDVKPANFLLSTGDHGEERVLLTDFGVAKSTDDTNELTQAGAFVATIAYASPEQLSGERLNHRADIYSLACSFFRLATGQNPYPGNQPAMVMIGHLHEPPPRLTAVDPTLPADIDKVLAVAMAKNPADRFDTCHDFTAALKSVLEYGVSDLSMDTVPQHRPAAIGVSEPSALRARTGNDSASDDFAESGASVDSKPSRPRRGVLIGTVAATAIALATGVGVWATQHNSAASTASGVVAPTSVSEARAQNPAFAGKFIGAVNVWGQHGQDPLMSVDLKPGPQAKFFEDLGFTYNPKFNSQGNEPNPRPANSGTLPQYEAMSGVDTGYVLAVRSDAEAGGGSLVNLPAAVTSSTATVIVLDDPQAVAALTEWSTGSEKVLLEKLLPILRANVK